MLRDALWNLKQSRTAKLILLTLLVLGVAALAGYVLFGGSQGGSSVANTNLPAQTSIPTELRRVLDGVFTKAVDANNLPAGVMVENLASARPQAGLDAANVVYEAPVEGGITRFLALYAGGTEAAKIGPVRSARSYFLDWAKEYGLLYVHAGGSPDALRKIETEDIRDLDQSRHNNFFWRDEERLKKKVPREHTLYTSQRLLTFAQRDLDLPATGSYRGWQFADAPALGDRPATVSPISIAFSTFHYKVEYTYDRATNTYARAQGEQPHVMEDGTPIRAANIVVQFVSASLVPGDAKGRLQLDTIGSGKALIFRNGERVVATWKKPSREERTIFTDENGTEVTFTAGNVWIEIVSNENSVTS